MKLIIDIPEWLYNECVRERYTEALRDIIARGVSYEPNDDLISRSALKEAVNSWCDNDGNDCDRFDFIDLIDQAPAVMNQI